ncbi:sugar transporter [Opitutaceae bacterium EW11]|nr:sugar transporter [Opitutaceae bacterium EW11]
MTRPYPSRWLALFLLVLGGLAVGLRADDAPPARPSYTIANTDRLRIAVYQEEDLSVFARVDAKGCVNLPLIGEVAVAGKTVSEAQRAIEAAYRDGRYLKKPQVTINIEEYAPREVSIDGKVRNPGRYPLPIEASMSVLDLVTKAGGLTDTAKGTAITVTRISADGKKSVFTVDVESLMKGKDRAKATDNSLVLQPGDIVYVPERII